MHDFCRRHFILAMAGSFLPLFTSVGKAVAAEAVKIRSLWGDRGTFSDVAQNLNGKSVEMRGYMAPPLKPEIDFVVYMEKSLQPVSFNDLITVTGTLELGTKTDANTGFVSRIRLMQGEFARV